MVQPLLQPKSGTESLEKRPPSPSSPPPALKRKKTLIACLTCQQKKRKCDGVRPRCDSCAKEGAQRCVYNKTLQEKHEELQQELFLLREKVVTLESEKAQLAAAVKSLIEDTDAGSQYQGGSLASLVDRSQSAAHTLYQQQQDPPIALPPSGLSWGFPVNRDEADNHRLDQDLLAQYAGLGGSSAFRYGSDDPRRMWPSPLASGPHPYPIADPSLFLQARSSSLGPQVGGSVPPPMPYLAHGNVPYSNAQDWRIAAAASTGEALPRVDDKLRNPRRKW